MDGHFDENTRGYAQVALLNELARDLSEEELSTFLAWTRDEPTHGWRSTVIINRLRRDHGRQGSGSLH